MGGRGSGSGQSERTRGDSVSVDDYANPIDIETARNNTNPYYEQSNNVRDKKYTHNCNRCWIAYEEQRRGLDCEARPTFEGDRWPYDCKFDAYEGIRWTSVGVVGTRRIRQRDTLRNLERELISHGLGARFGITSYWDDGGGHIYNAEVVRASNGRLKVEFVDAQTGKHGFIREYISNLRNTSNSIQYARIDQLRLRDEAREISLRRRGGAY